MSQFTIRRAQEADLERLIAIHQNAFPDGRSLATRRLNFMQNPRFHPDDLFVIEEDEHILGHAFYAVTHEWFGGKKLCVGTIASLGVAPEARDCGVATALLAHLHARSDQAGAALDLLYPFTQGFYQRFGYESVSPYVRLAAHPLAFPAGQRSALQPITGDDAAQIMALYERFCAERTGPLERSDERWERLWTNDAATQLCLRTGNQVTAYVSFSIHQAILHGPTRLLIHDWAWADARSQRVLWNWARSLAGQAIVIEVDVCRNDALLDAVRDAEHGRFGDAAVEHPVGTLAAGPSIRIVNLARALAARGYRSEETLTFAVGSERFTIHDGTLQQAAPNRAVDVTIAPAGIAQLAFGGVTADSLVTMGRLEGISAQAVAKAERVFSIPPFFSPDTF